MRGAAIPPARPSLRHAILAAGLSVLSAFAAPGRAGAEAYRIGPNDALRVSILEWDALAGEARQWGTLSASYPVDQDGRIALPMIGTVEVGGDTVDTVAAEIADALVAELALTRPPRVTVSIERYAPIFVGGLVESPGMYDYAPGLTVAKAVSLAGGVQKQVTEASFSLRNFVTASGNRHILEDGLVRLKVRRARLQAEAAGATEIADLPPPGHPAYDAIVADETRILTTSAQQFAQEVEGLRREAEMLEAAIASHSKKLEVLDEQIARGREALETDRQLAEQGLKVASAVLDRDRYVAELEGRRLDIELSLLQAEQDLQTNRRAEASLADERSAETAVAIQEVEAEIARTQGELAIERSLLSEAMGGALGPEEGELQLFAVTYTIERGTETIPVARGTEIRPGDLIEVVLDEPAGPPDDPAALGALNAIGTGAAGEPAEAQPAPPQAAAEEPEAAEPPQAAVDEPGRAEQTQAGAGTPEAAPGLAPAGASGATEAPLPALAGLAGAPVLRTDGEPALLSAQEAAETLDREGAPLGRVRPRPRGEP